MDENGHPGIQTTRRTIRESCTVTAAFLLGCFPRIALSAEASGAEAAVRPGTRYRPVMSPNHLVGNIVWHLSQGVESFVQGRAVKGYLCPIAPYLGARVAKASVWKFTPSRRIFLKTGYVVAHRPPSQRQSVLHARGNTLVLPGQPRRTT